MGPKFWKMTCYMPARVTMPSGKRANVRTVFHTGIIIASTRARAIAEYRSLYGPESAGRCVTAHSEGSAT